MARQFNVSAIFTAVNQLTAPVREMSQQISQFARSVHTSSADANQSLNSTGSAAEQLHRRIASLNQISFNGLTARLNHITAQISRTAQGFQSAGNAALGVGAAGLAGGYALNRTLEPVREAQRAANQLGVAYGQGKSVQDQATIGEAQYQTTAGLANKLPGAVADIADFRALTKRYGVEGNYDLIRGFTDALGAMGKSTLDNEVLSSIQSIMIGNQSDLFEKTGLKSFTDKKTHQIGIRDLATKQEFFFKSDAERIQFLSKFLGNKFSGGTELAMGSLVGRESNAGDALNAAAVDIWKNSGALALYNQKIMEFTKAVTELTPKVTAMIKPIAEWIKNNNDLVNSLLIGVPAMLGVGLALKTVGFALSGFAVVVRSVTGTIALLRTGFMLASTAATMFSAATGLALLPVATLVAGVAALGAAVYAVYSHWSELSAGFQQMKAKISADFAAWKLPSLDFSGIWTPIKRFFGQTLGWLSSTWAAFGLPALDFSGIWTPLKELFGQTLGWLSSTWAAFGLPVPDFSGIWDGLLSGFVKVINVIKSIWASLPSMAAPGVPSVKSNVTHIGPYAKQKAEAGAMGIYSKQEGSQNPKSIYSKPDYLQSKAPVVNLHQSIHNKTTPNGIQTVTKTQSPGLNIKLNSGINQRGVVAQ